jgi:hypothetical protein
MRFINLSYGIGVKFHGLVKFVFVIQSQYMFKKKFRSDGLALHPSTHTLGLVVLHPILVPTHHGSLPLWEPIILGTTHSGDHTFWRSSSYLELGSKETGLTQILKLP